MRAIIGGTGLSQLSDFEAVATESVTTPYGDEAVSLYRHRAEGGEFYFLPRHGADHSLPPHGINYRANIWALKEAGVNHIIAINAVGGINPHLGPGHLAIPDQLIDYTWGRDSSFFEGSDGVHHIDFTNPYSEPMRADIRRAVNTVLGSGSYHSRHLLDGGVFGVTQGPRLETAAEIRRMEREGCDMVGMTGMPEAALARELEMEYACLALSVNWGAGLTPETISLDEIKRVVEEGAVLIHTVLANLLAHSD